MGQQEGGNRQRASVSRQSVGNLMGPVRCALAVLAAADACVTALFLCFFVFTIGGPAHTCRNDPPKAEQQ